MFENQESPNNLPEKSLLEQAMEARKGETRSQDRRAHVSTGPLFFVAAESNNDETLKFSDAKFQGEVVGSQIQTWFDDTDEMDEYLFPILRDLAVLYQKNDYLTEQPDHLITIREVLLWAIAESGDPFLDSMVDDFCHDEDEDEDDFEISLN